MEIKAGKFILYYNLFELHSSSHMFQQYTTNN